VEVGPRDLAEGQVVVARRDDGTKSPRGVEGLAEGAVALLEEVQASMLAAATAARDERTVDVEDVEEALEAAQTGFVRIPWRRVDAAAIQRLGSSAVTVRCLQTPDGDLPDGTGDDELVAVCARSY
jgi:prolyl-tRNA synthetase